MFHETVYNTLEKELFGHEEAQNWQNEQQKGESKQLEQNTKKSELMDFIIIR